MSVRLLAVGDYGADVHGDKGRRASFIFHDLALLVFPALPLSFFLVPVLLTASLISTQENRGLGSKMTDSKYFTTTKKGRFLQDLFYLSSVQVRVNHSHVLITQLLYVHDGGWSYLSFSQRLFLFISLSVLMILITISVYLQQFWKC